MERQAYQTDEIKGGGSASSAIAGAMLELDRLTRPAIEHRIQAEKQTHQREDDQGGE